MVFFITCASAALFSCTSLKAAAASLAACTIPARLTAMPAAPSTLFMPLMAPFSLLVERLIALIMLPMELLAFFACVVTAEKSAPTRSIRFLITAIASTSFLI